MLNKVKMLLVALTATSMSFNAFSGGIIDDFLDPTPASVLCAQVTPGAPVDTCDALQGVGTIIGGEREIDLTWMSGIGAASVTVGGGMLNFSNDATVISNMVVTYDGVGFETMNEDLTWGGLTDTFAIDLTTLDLINGFDAHMIIKDVNNVSHQYDFPAAPAVAPITLFVPFAVFTGGGVDMTMVKSIVFDVTGAIADVDLGVSMIRKVPEPTTVAIMGLGLLGFGLLRRKKVL